jgi:hypothetical protein
MTLDEWIINGEVGTSSKTMWSVLKGIATGKEHCNWNFDYPHDPDDFRRCLLFYKNCNLIKEDLQKIGTILKWWKPFIDNWDVMVKLYEEESPKRSCPKLYELMQKLGDEAKILDGWTKTSSCSWERK